MFRVICFGVLAAMIALAGCEKNPAPTKYEGKHDDHDHDQKGKKLEDIELPDGTKCHAGLSAHFSALAGTELDVLFETTDKEAKPISIPLNAKVSARVTRKGDNEPKTVEFKPAKIDERKTDPKDRCSRFSADVPWMAPRDSLDIVVSVEYDGKLKKCTFSGFEPQKYAHEDE